jgi:EAL domain-containing protein (putative c-di-GMP-specific phosphodiesterase class I)
MSVGVRDLREPPTGSEPVRIAMQPIVDVVKRRVVGYEALARFGTAGTRGPGPVLRSAADTGHTVELELQLMAEGLAVQDRLGPDQFLAVNVGRAALMERELGRLLDGCDLSTVVLELSEHTLAVDQRALLRRLDSLRERGLRVALDDVGAGYAGLRQLLDIRPDVLKLDRGIIAGLEVDPGRQSVVQCMVDLSRRMGMQLVAEGVETTAELTCLMSLGVELAQGFLLGRPALRLRPVDHQRRSVRLDDALDTIDLDRLRDGPTHSWATVRLGVGSQRRPPAKYASRFAAALAVTNHDLGAAVVVDAGDRPVELVLLEADGMLTWLLPDTLPVQPPTEVLAIALLRPAGTRDNPVIIVDDEQRMLALVTLEQLRLLTGA